MVVTHETSRFDLFLIFVFTGSDVLFILFVKYYVVMYIIYEIVDDERRISFTFNCFWSVWGLVRYGERSKFKVKVNLAFVWKKN